MNVAREEGDAEEIRRIVAAKANRLPTPHTLRRLLRQPGCRQACLVCDHLIPPSRTEYELTDDTNRVYHVHPDCLTAWMAIW